MFSFIVLRYKTNNFVVSQPNSTNGGMALVSALGLQYGFALGLGTINSNAVVSCEGLRNLCTKEGYRR